MMNCCWTKCEGTFHVRCQFSIHLVLILLEVQLTSTHDNSCLKFSIVQGIMLPFYPNTVIVFVSFSQSIARENKEQLPAEIQPYTVPKDKVLK